MLGTSQDIWAKAEWVWTSNAWVSGNFHTAVTFLPNDADFLRVQPGPRALYFS